jgi:hypothetical protein
MCPIGVTWSSTKGTSPHRNVTCSRRDIAEQSGIKQQSFPQLNPAENVHPVKIKHLGHKLKT